MGVIGNIIYWPISKKEKVEKYQLKIRDYEWKSISKYLFNKTNFLDIGCGAGYAMMRAQNELFCSVYGIDPNPGDHGVGRYIKQLVEKVEIKKGMAENLPYENNSFSNIYSFSISNKFLFIVFLFIVFLFILLFLLSIFIIIYKGIIVQNIFIYIKGLSSKYLPLGNDLLLKLTLL